MLADLNLVGSRFKARPRRPRGPQAGTKRSALPSRRLPSSLCLPCSLSRVISSSVSLSSLGSDREPVEIRAPQEPLESLPPEAPSLGQPAGCLLEPAACLPPARPHSEPRGHCRPCPFTRSSVSCTNWELDPEASSECCSVATPWTAARQASLPITNSRGLLELTSIESVTPSSQLILCRPLSSRPQSFPASGSFPMSQFFASGGQSIGTSSSASVLPIQGPAF